MGKPSEFETRMIAEMEKVIYQFVKDGSSVARAWEHVYEKYWRQVPRLREFFLAAHAKYVMETDI